MTKGDYIKQIVKNTKEYKEEPNYLFPDFGLKPLPKSIAPEHTIQHQEILCDKVGDRCNDPIEGYLLNCKTCMFDKRNQTKFIEWVNENQEP